MSRIGGVRCVLSCLLLAGIAVGPSPGRATTRAEFDTFAAGYLTAYYEFRPVQATRDGVHLHDGVLGTWTREKIAAEVARLQAALAVLREMQPATLDSARRVDQEILLGNARGQILELDVIRPWQTDPGHYVGLVAEGAQALAARNFAPAAERLRSLIAREKAIGSLLAAAAENLVNPPRLRTELAIERTRGALAWFRDSLPRAFESVTDPALKAEFEKSNAQTLLELEGFLRYLVEDLLPFSRGELRLGPETLQSKLLYDELCDVPLLRLEWIGSEEVGRLQTDVKATATRLDPQKTPEELYHIYSMDHPTPERLLTEAGRLPAELRSFCESQVFVDLPPDAGCGAIPMPQFRRGLLVAALDPPGPLETKGREAWYTLAPPDSALAGLARDDYLGAFSRYELPFLSMEETWPGALLLASRDQHGLSRVRRALGCRSFNEGWPLYAAQVAVEQGYGENDPRHRLFQLRQVLAATCRSLVVLRFHGGQLTREEAVEFLMKQAYLDRLAAEREALRAIVDPGSLAEGLGRLAILKLRDDTRRAQGSAFDLRRFHNRLLGYGSPPFKPLRRMLLPGDKGTML